MDHTGLPKDWVLRPAIDLELKQYMLLAYLQRVHARFAERKLYPHLRELRMHLDELLHLRRSKEDLARSLTGELLGFDPLTGNAVHERPREDDLLGVIDEVIGFAMSGLKRTWSEGSGLRQAITERIRLFPVGVQPLDPAEGWLLLSTGRHTRVYAYVIPLVQAGSTDTAGPMPIGPGMITRYVTTYTMGITCTYEHIRSELIARRDAPAVPATFALEAEPGLPHIETFMPLAKQLVGAHLAGTERQGSVPE